MIAENLIKEDPRPWLNGGVACIPNVLKVIAAAIRFGVAPPQAVRAM
jgi:hypothetical protein